MTFTDLKKRLDGTRTATVVADADGERPLRARATRVISASEENLGHRVLYLIEWLEPDGSARPAYRVNALDATVRDVELVDGDADSETLEGLRFAEDPPPGDAPAAPGTAG